MTATASNLSRRCWGRRPHFPFGGLLTTAETERWILWVRQWSVWPVCRFPGHSQQPSDSMYLWLLWQLGRRCTRWPVYRFCWLLHLPLWQCRQCAILHMCLGQWHTGLLACLWTVIIIVVKKFLWWCGCCMQIGRTRNQVRSAKTRHGNEVNLTVIAAVSAFFAVKHPRQWFTATQGIGCVYKATKPWGLIFEKILWRIYNHKFIVTKLWRTYDEVVTNLWS